MVSNEPWEGCEIRLLLVEDTPDVAQAVVDCFVRHGDAVDLAATRAAAEDMLAVERFDAIILDINLPDGDGIELLDSERKKGQTTPVLMLTARMEIDDRVTALDVGADDYLIKPFDLRELEARVRALVRRAQGNPAEGARIMFGGLDVDLAGHTAHGPQGDLVLTRREFSLLEVLLLQRGRVVSKEQIFSRMFGFDEEDRNLNAIEIYVGRLRRKLEQTGVRIRTLRGLGYQLVQDD